MNQNRVWSCGPRHPLGTPFLDGAVNPRHLRAQVTVLGEHRRLRGRVRSLGSCVALGKASGCQAPVSSRDRRSDKQTHMAGLLGGRSAALPLSPPPSGV